MKKVICDTNIWYGIGNGTIIKPTGVKLIATWINIIELGFSNQENKKNIDPEIVKKAAKAILDYADEIIELDPFKLMAQKFDKEIKFDFVPVKEILNEVVKDGLPSFDTYKMYKKSYDLFLRIKNDFALNLNLNKKNLRKTVLSNNTEKEKYKKTDEEQLIVHAYSVFLDTESFLKTENMKIIISGEEDFLSTIELIKDKFELYVNAKQKLIKKWVLTKSMKIENNDFFDLLNFVYVGKEHLFWTKEIRWLTIIGEADMSKYLFE